MNDYNDAGQIDVSENFAPFLLNRSRKPRNKPRKSSPARSVTATSGLIQGHLVRTQQGWTTTTGRNLKATLGVAIE